LHNEKRRRNKAMVHVQYVITSAQRKHVDSIGRSFNRTIATIML
jgi:hypothetical protein